MIENGLEANICIQANQPVCQSTDLTVQIDTIHAATYQTTASIFSSGVVGMDNPVEFMAAQTIQLLPGFKVDAGADFHAHIDDCSANLLIEPDPTPLEEKIIVLDTNTEVGFIKDFAVAPNPFSNETTLSYQLEKETSVSLKIFTMNGSIAKEIVPPITQSAGFYTYEFAPDGLEGNIYFAVMTTDEAVLTKKMIFIR